MNHNYKHAMKQSTKDKQKLKNQIDELKHKYKQALDKIKKTYKKLVKIFHPDVNGNDKKAEEKFKEINNSYKILLKKFKND